MAFAVDIPGPIEVDGKRIITDLAGLRCCELNSFVSGLYDAISADAMVAGISAFADKCLSDTGFDPVFRRGTIDPDEDDVTWERLRAVEVSGITSAGDYALEHVIESAAIIDQGRKESILPSLLGFIASRSLVREIPVVEWEIGRSAEIQIRQATPKFLELPLWIVPALAFREQNNPWIEYFATEEAQIVSTDILQRAGLTAKLFMRSLLSAELANFTLAEGTESMVSRQRAQALKKREEIQNCRSCIRNSRKTQKTPKHTLKNLTSFRTRTLRALS